MRGDGRGGEGRRRDREGKGEERGGQGRRGVDRLSRMFSIPTLACLDSILCRQCRTLVVYCLGFICITVSSSCLKKVKSHNCIIAQLQHVYVFNVCLCVSLCFFLSRVSIMTRNIDIANLSVRPSARLSVTFRYQMKTA